MITDNKQSDEIDKWHYIALKSDSIDNGFNWPIRSLSRLFRGIDQIIMEIFIVWVVFIHLELIMYLKNTKDYVTTMIIAM